MPIYEYQCSSCGRIVEVIQKFDDAPLDRCEECSGEMQKIFSRTSFQLEGGGWYGSGYAKSASGSSESGGEKDSRPPDSSKTESAKSESGKKNGGCGSGCGCH